MSCSDFFCVCGIFAGLLFVLGQIAVAQANYYGRDYDEYEDDGLSPGAWAAIIIVAVIVKVLFWVGVCYACSRA